MRDIDGMKMSLAQRIQSRLDALGKNPSSVALEAGLSRSAVRDILTSKANHPRIDTLARLVAPLECTLDYLAGVTDDPTEKLGQAEFWQFDVEMKGVHAVIEAGVFRQNNNVTHETIGQPVHLRYRDYRVPALHVGLFEMGDDSLEGVHILKGDVLSVAEFPGDDQLTLVQGLLVLARHRLSKHGLEEISVREVRVVGSSVHLVCHSPRPIPAIVLANYDADQEPNGIVSNSYLTDDDGIVLLDGVVVRVTRQLPIGVE